MGKVAAQPDEYVLHATGWTVREYDALPEDFPRCELIEGELWLSPAPNLGHQWVAGEIFALLRSYLERDDSGYAYMAPVDFEVSEETILQPDVLVIPRGHPQYGKPVPRLTAPPILAVEVVSPSSSLRDRKQKLDLYQRAGVPFYWIADPKPKAIEAWSLVDGRYVKSAIATSPDTFTAQPFDGLVIPLAKVFKLA